MKLQLVLLTGVVLTASDAHERWMKHVTDGYALWKERAVAPARAAFERALQPAEELARLGDPLVVPATHSHLADLYVVTGRLDRAEWHALEGLRQLEAVRDEASLPIEGKLRMSLGVAYFRTGREPAGESEFLRATALYRKSRKVDLSEFGLALINVATVRLGQKRYGEAENLFLEVVAMQQSPGAQESASLAFAHEGFGVLHLERRRYAEAERELSAALGIMSRLYGGQIPEIARMLDLHALALAKLKRKKEAQAVSRQARDIREKMGPNWNGSSISIHSLRSGK